MLALTIPTQASVSEKGHFLREPFSSRPPQQPCYLGSEPLWLLTRAPSVGGVAADSPSPP